MAIQARLIFEQLVAIADSKANLRVIINAIIWIHKDCVALCDET